MPGSNAPADLYALHQARVKNLGNYSMDYKEIPIEQRKAYGRV